MIIWQKKYSNDRSLSKERKRCIYKLEHKKSAVFFATATYCKSFHYFISSLFMDNIFFSHSCHSQYFPWNQCSSNTRTVNVIWIKIFRASQKEAEKQCPAQLQEYCRNRSTYKGSVPAQPLANLCLTVVFGLGEEV